MTEILAISIGVALAGGLIGLAFGCIIGRECSSNWDLLRKLEHRNNRLEEEIEIMTDFCGACKKTHEEQLEKAKKMLKEAQDYIENIDDVLYDEIKQFLKEIEVTVEEDR